MSAARTVGVIGLGRMGYPMARNLAAAGLTVVGCDARAEVRQRFAAEGHGRAVATPAEIGAACETVVLMLPDGAAVRAVVLGAGGGALADAMRPGGIIVDMSSSAPTGTRELGRLLEPRGLRLLDAPVSGGVKKAEAGTLAIMVGGERALADELSWLFQALGEKVFYAGPLGTGHAMKALNNYVSAAGLTAAAEALRVGQAFGLEPGVMVDILNASTGRNNSTENKFHQFILSGTYASGFALELMAKDIAIAAALAQETGRFTPLLEQCEGVWSEAQRRAAPGADHTEIYRYLETGPRAGEHSANARAPRSDQVQLPPRGGKR